MWQTVLVVLAVAAAGWYVFRRLRRTVRPGSEGTCACGGHEGGPCPLTEARDEPQPHQCQGCDQCPPSAPPPDDARPDIHSGKQP